jgi:hypothetical protein
MNSVDFEMLLDEAGPPGEAAERWIAENKAKFKERYGEKWEKYLYGHAWRIFGKKRVISEGAEAEVMNGSEISLTVSGPTASGKTALLRALSDFLSDFGCACVFEDRSEQSDAADLGDESPDLEGLPANIELRVRYESFEPLTEAAWWDKYIRRSLTRAESAGLKIPRDKLGCTVMHFSDKSGKDLGFKVYTHRCASKFYKKTSDIPAKTLEFISSTG